ncbi:MAG: DUF4174 domain-containing protein [Pseudomonadota bacterium]
MKARAVAASAFLVALVTAPFAKGEDGSGLSSVRWEYRPLLIFTPSEDDPRLSRQTTRLADDAYGMRDRRLAVYVVERRRVFTLFGAPAPQASAKLLRRRFGVADETFKVVLVGLDGGAKLTASEPVDAAQLFDRIDGMPMRRRELEQRRERERGKPSP